MVVEVVGGVFLEVIWGVADWWCGGWGLEQGLT